MRTTLQTATGNGVASLWARVDRFNRRVSERPMDLAWHRPSPLVVLHDRTSRSDVKMNVTASLRLAWNQTVLGRSEPVPLPAMAALRPAIVTPRLETRIERHHLETWIVPSATVAPASPTVMSAADPQATPSLPPPVATTPAPPTRRSMAAPRVEMILAPTPQAIAGSAVAAATRAIDGRSPAPAPLVPTPAPQEMRIDRITAEVVRALDSRLISFRERMGDR